MPARAQSSTSAFSLADDSQEGRGHVEARSLFLLLLAQVCTSSSSREDCLRLMTRQSRTRSHLMIRQSSLRMFLSTAWRMASSGTVPPHYSYSCRLPPPSPSVASHNGVGPNLAARDGVAGPGLHASPTDQPRSSRAYACRGTHHIARVLGEVDAPVTIITPADRDTRPRVAEIEVKMHRTTLGACQEEIAFSSVADQKRTAGEAE